ncbi:MFS general substrate transporter [Auriscalpium vulgare]|uniref:MFS general substrate transporter n=1 Tax=Auriscalpium vulgare TaxID=40419 RepID=A0ACB8S5I1_9AGAM|nr:MFS general substrate transporter [Auriscalpium vulgare]
MSTDPEKRAKDVESSDAHSLEPASTAYDEFDTPEDRRLLRKIDLRWVSPLTVNLTIVTLSTQTAPDLDAALPAVFPGSMGCRSTNIGNAKIDGLTTDLKVSPASYNTALALYFIAYVTFEVPANIVLKRFDPQFWLPTLTFAWGVASIAQGLVTNRAGLFGIRILLGATEAGLFPGTIYVFSVYYRRKERHWRVAIFFGGAALSGAFGGILAYAIGKMDGVGGKRGWQWIFILEGLLTVVVSWIAYFFVPTWAHKATFLTDVERARLAARLASDSDAAHHERFAWVYVRQAFADPLVWGYALLFHGFAFVLYTLSLFMPTIIAGLGFATWKAQLMTVPPNTLAALGIATGAWLAAKTRRRAPLIIGAAAIAIIGYIVLITTSTPGAQYVGVHFAALGVYTGNALLLSWPAENISGQTKRAVGVAMQITIGDLGAVTGVLLYRPAYAAHHFRKPHIIAVGYLLFAVAVASALWVWMDRENRRREAVIVAGEDEEVDFDTKVLLGDREVHWRYQT